MQIFAATFLIPLLWTVLVEVTVVALLAGRSRRVLVTAVLANTLTHPPATFAYLLLYPAAVLLFGTAESLALTGAIELAVFGVECAVYRTVLGWPTRRALAIAGVANGLTWAITLLS